MRTLPLLFFVGCGPGAASLLVLEEGLTGVPPEDECLFEPAVRCCDDITIVRLTDASAQIDVSENDLGGEGRLAQVNYLDETGVIAFTSSCPGDASRLSAVDLRVDDEGVATITYELVTDEGDGTTDPVRPYSVVAIGRPAAEITGVLYEIAIPVTE